jgi:hypothetical protein
VPVEPGTSPSPIRLTLYPLEECAPCAIVKAALDHPDFARFGAVETYVLDIEEIRDLRRRIGRLAFPILVASVGERIVARRIGATFGTADEERPLILQWLAGLEQTLEAGQGPRGDPEGAGPS